MLQPLVLTLATRAPRGPVLAAAALLTGLGFGATAFAHTVSAFALTVAVWTLGEVLHAPVSSALVSERSPAHLRGRYQAAFGLTWSLAFVAAPMLGPRLIERVGLDAFWGLCLALATAAAGAFLALDHRARATGAGL
ncbi:MAG: hypothetical protein INH37_27315 [Myxococcaceae bacterium]|nr:hypothetical protein [Myxococcaceae bacterium]